MRFESKFKVELGQKQNITGIVTGSGPDDFSLNLTATRYLNEDDNKNHLVLYGINLEQLKALARNINAVIMMAEIE